MTLICWFAGEEMDAKEVITERVLDGGAPSDIDNEDSKGNTTMTENDGVAEQNGLQKKKAKKVFLDRRARKNLPSAEDISRVRCVRLLKPAKIHLHLGSSFYELMPFPWAMQHASKTLDTSTF